MENFDNDSDIKINVRTGTSTRRSVQRENNTNQFSIYDNLLTPSVFEYNIVYNRDGTRTVSIIRDDYPGQLNNLFFNFSDAFLNSVIQRSLNDTELKRDPNIRIDSHYFVCEKADEKKCSICQSNFCVGEKLVKSSCGHTHHYECLNEWVKYKSSCPECRKDIPVLEK